MAEDAPEIPRVGAFVLPKAELLEGMTATQAAEMIIRMFKETNTIAEEVATPTAPPTVEPSSARPPWMEAYDRAWAGGNYPGGLDPSVIEVKVPRVLGEKSDTPRDPTYAQLATEYAPYPDLRYNVRFTYPEFTSLCPVTGQPDSAIMILDYLPSKRIVESKSLKLFLQSFRNHGGFHEKITLYIAQRVQEATECRWLRISGFWMPRGGIPIDVTWQSGPTPKGVHIPPVDIHTYRGR